jgi:NAD(P)-dependent dehydrogenase (short-subunit alcohol dehydrogenase family)
MLGAATTKDTVRLVRSGVKKLLHASRRSIASPSATSPGGSIRGGMARVFAPEGARVFLTGRSAAKLEAVAERIRSAGGAAETLQPDEHDEPAVNDHADAVVARGGSLDTVTSKASRWRRWSSRITSGPS